MVEKIQQSARGGELARLESEFTAGVRIAPDRGDAMAPGERASATAPANRVSARRTIASIRGPRARGHRWRRTVGEGGYRDFTGDTPKPDVNYVFPTFVTTRLPMGLVGLIIAAIFAAAMSSIAAELNSLATVDRHRHLPAPDQALSASDAHYLLRLAGLRPAFWGIVRLLRRARSPRGSGRSSRS